MSSDDGYAKLCPMAGKDSIRTLHGKFPEEGGESSHQLGETLLVNCGCSSG